MMHDRSVSKLILYYYCCECATPDNPRILFHCVRGRKWSILLAKPHLGPAECSVLFVWYN